LHYLLDSCAQGEPVCERFIPSRTVLELCVLARVAERGGPPGRMHSASLPVTQRRPPAQVDPERVAEFFKPLPPDEELQLHEPHILLEHSSKL